MRKLIIGGLVAVMTMGLVLSGNWLAGSTDVVEANPGTGWNAAYYNNADLLNAPVLTRTDDWINFNWADGAPAGVPVNADNFSVRWTKTVNFPTAGQWSFRAGADDGIRMWIDATLIIDQWNDAASGYQTYEVTIDQLTAGNHELKVEYYERTGLAGVQVVWGPGASASGTGTTTDGSGSTGTTGNYTSSATWTAEYFNNTNLDPFAVLTQTESSLNYNWGANAPAAGVNADNFSARWKATVNFPVPGRWRFRATVDDGVRAWIDVTQILDKWQGTTTRPATYEVDVYALTAGNHDLTVEFYEATGDARITFEWVKVDEGTGAATGDTTQATAVPTAKPVLPVVAAVTGNNVNVRSAPGRGNPVITQVQYPNNYRVLGAVPDLTWVLIDLRDGRQGWVSNEWVWLFTRDTERMQDTTGGGYPDFVDDIPRIDLPVAPPADLPPLEDRPATVLTGRSTANVNLRDGPSVGAANKIATVPIGETFTVEARNSNGSWYLINYRGVRGWVSAQYVALLDGEVRQLLVSSEVVEAPPFGQVFVPEDEAGNPAVTVVGRANTNLRLRDSASIFGEQIGSIPGDTELVIEARNQSGSWYLVTFEGQQGWINSPYVTLIEGRVADLLIR